jgi:CRP/FNR family transcriptional regulator
MHRLPSTLEARVQALQENRYLRGLDNEVLENLAESTHLLSYASEENILIEGQPGPGLFIIESGRVKIFKGSPTGREMIINVLEEGDSFNEVPVFDQGENPANVEAVMDTQLWLIEAKVLGSLISNHPQAAHQIIINLSQNLRMMVAKVAELSFFKVTVRLARLLKDLPETQLAERGLARLTQDDLAARIGTVREVVARSLKELETCGAIELQRGRIKILDRKKLDDWESP